jgi:AraC-like DNA-binding protein
VSFNLGGEENKFDDVSATTLFDYLTQFYTKELSILLVEKETGISERQISTIIKQRTGLSFNQFLNQLRITEARRLLIETKLNVSEIAYKVGYGNVSHFNRVFKSAVGYSPNEFRLHHASSLI